VTDKVQGLIDRREDNGTPKVTEDFEVRILIGQRHFVTELMISDERSLRSLRVMEKYLIMFCRI
jgi:hypothetical protein